jgi:hypothetical protein
VAGLSTNSILTNGGANAGSKLHSGRERLLQGAGPRPIDKMVSSRAREREMVMLTRLTTKIEATEAETEVSSAIENTLSSN